MSAICRPESGEIGGLVGNVRRRRDKVFEFAGPGLEAADNATGNGDIVLDSLGRLADSRDLLALLLKQFGRARRRGLHFLLDLSDARNRRRHALLRHAELMDGAYGIQRNVKAGGFSVQTG